MDEITVTEPRPVAPGISGNDLASLLGGAQQAEQAIKAREASNKKVAGEVRTGMTTVQDQLKSLTEQHNKDKAALGSLPNLQSEKFKAPDEVDPVQSFGSFASMLAMAGSLMTRAPLTTALRASAAGMNAIKQNNADAFDKAFEVWKANSDAALKQANFELEKYGVASQMMNTDYAQGVALARTQASLIQDHVALAALESPDPKDYLDLMNSRQAAVIGLAKAMPELEWAGIQYKLWNQWSAEHPGATPEEQAGFAERVFSGGSRGASSATAPSTRAFNQWEEEYKTTHNGQVPSSEEKIAKIAELGAANLGAKQDVAKLTPEQEAKHTEMKGRIESALDQIDGVEKAIEGSTAITGIGGAVTRPFEAIGNLAGITDQTKRKDFEAALNLLKIEGPQLLMDRTGRPLSAEQAKFDSIIGGLKFGDTKQNTLSRLRSVKELLKSHLHTTDEILSPGDDQPKPKPAAGGGKSRWETAPVVGD